MKESKKVVLAEDEPLIRFLVADAMRDAGFEVMEAEHAEEALGHLRSRAAIIHLLFTDIHMPGQMSGHALASYVAQIWPISRCSLRLANRQSHNSLPAASF